MAQSKHERETVEEFIERMNALASLWDYPPMGGGDDDDSDDDSDDDGDSDDDDSDDKDGDTPEARAQKVVDDAFEKLRAAEAREKEANKKLQAAERKGMSEAETAVSERDAAREEAAALQERLDAIEKKTTVTEIATALKFRHPAKAARFVSADSTDEKSIRADLKDALKDVPELAGNGVTPPPMNEGSEGNSGSGNARMNQALRAAAGRG